TFDVFFATGCPRLGRNVCGAACGSNVTGRFTDSNWGLLMKVNKVHAAVVAALTGAGGLYCQTAFAQEGLEEIVVTATRREENLQEVPISTVAIPGDNPELRGLDNLEELSQGVPNVIITGGGGGPGGTVFRMRGIPNVGTYVDGVWQVGTAG